MHKFTKFLIFFGLTFLSSQIFAQRGDPTLLAVGLHTGNRIGISFHNDGQIAGILSGVDIRGEWPFGSGENYIGDCIPLIGVEFVNDLNETLHSVIISRGPRSHQSEEKSPIDNHFWGWNPIPGFRNPNYESVAMSHLPDSWPVEGWNDPIAKNWRDSDGKTQWFGYFGRGIINADQESLFDADDQADDEFNFLNYNPANPIFLPDSTDPTRHGMGLRMRVRGFQWSNFLAEDAIFWLYDITNEGTTIYRKADFGTVVGTLAGGDGDSGDDLGYFDVENWITYSWDSDGIGNHGQKVGYVGYAFLESPGNPFDGIDNDDDDNIVPGSTLSYTPSAPKFVASDFDSVKYNAGDQVVLINPATYERTLHTVSATTDTVYSMGVRFIIEPGKTYFKEGRVDSSIINGSQVYNPDPDANDGIDNDLDGLIDENEAIHYLTRVKKGLPGLRYINYVTGAGRTDLLIDERRDNNIDEDGDWNPQFDDVGIDGLGSQDNGYPGPDFGEGNGIPDQGEPNFGRTDPDESDQIGLTSFNFFNLTASPDMRNDSLLWGRMTPGRFDVIPPIPQDGDFIYASGFFPLVPANGNIDIKERFSVSLLFGENLNDIVGNKEIVQQIYNAGYKFPQPPRKPKITLTQEDGNVVIYWNGDKTENDRDFITKKRDFEGYKIYRATDASFRDARIITNGQGILSFDKPLKQYDLIDSIKGYFYPSQRQLEQVGGTSFYLGENTGIVNKFVDTDVIKGQTYYYAVCAYDAGDASLDIFPTENSKFIRRSNIGQIITDINTGYITPGARSIGYQDAALSNFDKSPNFIGTGSVSIDLIDDQAIKPGFSYKVVFQDTGAANNTKSWSLLDLQTPDTVYVPITGETTIVEPLQSISLPSGTDTIYVNGSPKAVSGNTYTAPYDSLVNESSVFNGNTPVNHGFRMQIVPDQIVKQDTTDSGFENTTSPFTGYTFTVVDATNKGVTYPNDYVIEFYSTIVDTSLADTLLPKRSTNTFAATPVNFKVKNTTQNKYIDFLYKRTGLISASYSIIFKEVINNQLRNTWRVAIDYAADQPLEQNGTLTLITSKPFSSTDFITFTMKGAEIDKDIAKTDMDKIKVVPNPYVVTHQAEASLLSTQTSGRGEREIRFTHIPPGSKISIFTVRGELIRTLTHDDLFVGDVYWNLRTDENLDAAFGVYVFVVESPGIGTKIGKFALIK